MSFFAALFGADLATSFGIGAASMNQPYLLDLEAQFGKDGGSGQLKMDYNRIKSLVDRYDRENANPFVKAELLPGQSFGNVNYLYNCFVKIAKTLLGSIALYNDYGAKSNPNRFWVYLIKRISDKYNSYWSNIYWSNQLSRLSGLTDQALFTELKGAFFKDLNAQKAFLKDYEQCIKSGCITMGEPVKPVVPVQSLRKNGGSRKTFRTKKTKTRSKK
jgi:hypothetical protein